VKNYGRELLGKEMNRMTDREAELIAEQVLNAYRQAAPVDLELIAREEGIELLEGNFGDEFEGRLEFLSDLGTFVLYHPSLETAQYPGRVRFSIAHELAHYFIESHRQGIIQGLFHDSEEGFQSLNIIEDEADRVAAALLIPAKELRSKMGHRKILTLRQILELAARCEASVQATSFRYARYAEEACLAVVASGNRILYAFSSDEADGLGFRFLGIKHVPVGSAAHRASESYSAEIFEGPTDTSLWFSQRGRSAELWEEAVRLGSSSLVLTLLSWKEYEADD
jgi:Zn-dependent peptidase ImmA (M78 family)